MSSILEAKRAAITYAVNKERARRLNTIIVTVDGIPFDGDPTSRDNMAGLLTATANGVPVPWAVPWRCADNVIRPLSYATAIQVSAAIITEIQRIYSACWYIKDEIIPQLTLEQIQVFDVTNDELWV